MIVTRMISLLDKTEGRDKLTKTLIYLLKLVDSFRSFRIHAPSFRFSRIAIRFQHARQLMRLGKSLYQIQQIVTAVKSQTKDEFDRMMSIICFASYGVYWLLDNMTIINEYNFSSVAPHLMKEYAMTAKFIGLFFALVLNFRNFIRLHAQELKTRERMKVLKDKQNLQAQLKKMELVSQQHKELYMLIKTAGDMLPTIAKSVLAKRIFKFEISKVLQNAGGLISALSACTLVGW